MGFKIIHIPTAPHICSWKGQNSPIIWVYFEEKEGIKLETGVLPRRTVI